MTLLHDLFTSRNLQGFQRLLDGSSERGKPPAPSTSGGKSWNRPSPLTAAFPKTIDVNAGDWLGRTALHLACTSMEHIEYVRALLKHSGINVNLADKESHWTPLHRALYHANLPAALLLLQRSDIDPSLKDLEGYTAFDLYNSTLNGTKPSLEDKHAELFTWGTNRNAALGLGDGDDRVHPDQVVIQSQVDSAELEKMSLAARLSPIHVHQIQMSKLHTAVVTSESGGNVRVCGFGSGGRLGPGQHTQYSLKSLPQLTHTIVSVALGQDHTLALTKSGEVLSWGLNRFSQLGYIVESSSTARHEEQIQSTPKKIYGPLRKELVRGVAASKWASACWTEEEVFTWGTNNGQLGYDKAAQPVQVLPRKITKVTQPVIAIALTDSAMACLLRNQQVECIWNDRHYRINFPTQAFPSEIQPYRPPQAIKDPHISKITSCDDVFAALSSNGEVFTFSVPSSSSTENFSTSIPTESSGSRGGCGVGGAPLKPQRVWALRKKFSAVKDVALGADGSIIICTEAGHVFVRTRNAKGVSGKAFKFHRIPYLQRVTQVCANSTGAYGALRVDFKPKEIEVRGASLAEDLAGVQPYMKMYRAAEDDVDGYLKFLRPSRLPSSPRAQLTWDERMCLVFAEDTDDVPIREDLVNLLDLVDVFTHERTMHQEADVALPARLPHGADTILSTELGATFPVHRLVLAARSPVFRTVLAGRPVEQQPNIVLRLLPANCNTSSQVAKLTHLSISGCHPFSVLVLLQYLYSDKLPAIWDRRVYITMEKRLAAAGINHAQVKADLQALARVLDLPLLFYALDSPSKRVPAPSLTRDVSHLFELNLKLESHSPLAPNVVLQLADKDVHCHSFLLRARSDLFASFFDEHDWTAKRWGDDGMIKINLKHLSWNAMEYVLKFMLCGEEEALFESLAFARTVDNVLDFMFDVMAAANELLLDRLVLLCSVVILKYSNIHNACYILADATHYHATQLVESIQGYMTANMESLLESRMLDDIPYALVKQLAKFARQQQTKKSPYSRSGIFINQALEKHAEWLSLQDIPEPIIAPKTGPRKEASKVKLSPPGATKKPVELLERRNLATPPRALRRLPSGDEVFIMDDPESPQAESLPPQSACSPPAPPTPTSPPVWKASTAPRVDMKTLMVEAAAMSRTPSLQGLSNQKTPGGNWKIPHSEMRKTSSSDGPTDFPLLGEPSPSKKAPGSHWRNFVDQGGPRSTPPAAVPPVSNPSATSFRAGGSAPRSQLPLGRPQHTMQGLGPMITPTKQSPSKTSSFSSSRSVSGNGKAWTLPPVQAVATPTPIPVSGVSFVAIQHSQQEQQQSDPVKDRRSLREIQEEEQSLQAEADFLKWWTAEEERVKQEAEALERSRNAHSSKKPQRRKGGGAKARPARSGGGVDDRQPKGSGVQARSHRGQPNQKGPAAT